MIGVCWLFRGLIRKLSPFCHVVNWLRAPLAAALIIVATEAIAADVEVTTNTATVDLDTFVGTTAHVATGVTVSNSVKATLQAWGVTNDGTVNGVVNNGDAISLTQGGSVTNSAGASIGGANTGVFIGILGAGGGAGVVDNFGIITGTNAEGVTLADGGTVTNYLGATVSTSNGLNAVSVGNGVSRTVVNSGSISATRTTGFVAGVLVQGGASTVTNNSTGTIFGSYNGVYSSNSVNLTLINNGSITSTRGPAIEVDGGGGTVTNTGTVSSAAPGTLAAIRFSGAGTLNNSGTITSTGGGRAITFVGAGTHTLNLSTGSVINGSINGTAGSTDNLVMFGTGTESMTKFVSFETASMQGANWELTGTGAFTTSATVQSGLLRVNGTLTSPAFAVLAGGTLGGTGTIVGAVTNNGIVAPGNSIGTLNITGNYIQATGSSLNVEVSTAPAADLLNITGTATIQGGAGVNVFAAPGLYTIGQRYTILTALGGRAGTYDTLTDNAPFVDFTLAYDPNNVYLDVLRSSVTFAQLAQTPNQRAAAGGIEALGAGNSVFDAVVMLDAANSLRAFDLLSGEIHASVKGTLTEESRFVREAIMDRVHQVFGGIASLFGSKATAVNYAADDDALSYAQKRKKAGATKAIDKAIAPAEAPEAFTAWGHVFGNWGKMKGDGNAAALDRDTGGFVTGIDRGFGSSGNPWRFGLATGYQHSSVNVGDRSSSASIGTYHLAAYGATQYNALALRFGAAQAWHEIDTTRTISFPGFANVTKAGYGAATTQVFGEAGYGFTYGRVAAEPFAALAYVHVKADGFTESGGAAALTSQRSSDNTTFSTLGLRAGIPLAAPGGWAVAAKGTLGWRHAFGDPAPLRALAFATGGSAFTIAGTPIAKDALLFEAGLDATLGRDIVIGVLYSGQYGSAVQDHAVKGEALRRF